MTLPRLHVLVTDAVTRQEGFEARCAQMQEECGDDLALHLRLREAATRPALLLAESLEEGAMETGGLFVVNARVDVALLVGAGAVQLGVDAMPLPVVRELTGDSLLIGASIHDVRAADERRREGADFLVAGSVYATDTHPDVEPAGPGLLRRVAHAGLPVIAIGGVRADRVPEVLGAGAHGVAVIGAVWGREDPVKAAAELCGELKRAS